MLCAPYNSTKTPYYPAAYPTDRVILLTSKIFPENRKDIRASVWEDDEEPLIGKGGPQNVTYHGIMTDDAFFELYEKMGPISESSTQLTNKNSNATAEEEEEEDLGTLVWRFGRVPFKRGLARLIMQWDGNLVIYSYGHAGEYGDVASISNDCYEALDNGVTYYDNFYLAWLPEENQAAVFPGYWDEDLPRVWSSSDGLLNTLPYTPEDYNVLIPVTRTSSVLSVLGSLLVLYMIVGQWIKRKKWSNTRDRILVGVCFLDLFFSIGLGIATAATPSDFRGVVGAMGSVGFCDAQGFMIQLGMSVPMYYCGLSLVFLLYVIKGKRIRFVATRVEPMIHFFVWTIALSTAITGLVLELYNSNGQFCYIEPYPYNCETEYIDCTRGEAGITLVWFFAVVLVGVPNFGTTILMIALYYSVWDQDRKLRQRYGDLWNGNMDRLKKIKVQAFLYIGGFFVVWFWTSIRLLQGAIGIESPFWLEIASSCTLPLQGFFNFLVFVRQPIAQTKKDHPDKAFLWVVLTAIKDYPFVETEQQRRNHSSRSRSFRGLRDSSHRGMSRKSARDQSQRSGRDQSHKSIDMSQKSVESGNFFSNSRLFVLGKGKDEEGAC